MKVEIEAKTKCEIDITPEEAFRILCKTLQMDIVLDEDRDFFVYKNENDENAVYAIRNGHDECFDDRGDLFVALRNVAVNMFPNTAFRNAEYIYGNR